MQTLGRPKKYTTEAERKSAKVKNEIAWRRNTIKNMTEAERKAYYRAIYDGSKRKELAMQRHIKNATDYLISMGFEVIEKGGE